MIEIANVMHPAAQSRPRDSAHVTSMHAGKDGQPNTLIVDDVRCLLHLSDGKNVGSTKHVPLCKVCKASKEKS